ncbi:MAG: hypothetical protein COT81_01990 [Candidatus Buchananbacteria bacterium CG10_big_fil_rev_8_21_14_0_10_42_9]|uniref:Fibronectin type-III domain-containing protein n=1 Tax=Candidatus Buchananbacteria bacterium CG10_big_fil_rev_8_21_14_0_10_42_9 TaxID=1974526 RepID=A0A2H0W3P7_9BACT|nr:MAG: hypothetical protein COT81_01990 [Candidatus Buchananbacteria bacterium CG10_big_fil_rev_8_21_14_0_10_42_9]
MNNLLTKKVTAKLLIIMLILANFLQFSPLLAALPLTISNISVEAEDDTAVITWNTNFSANARVEFEPDEFFNNDTNYRYFLISDKLNTAHEFRLTNLVPDTVYHFRIISQTADQEVETFDQIFETEERFDSQSPIISDVRTVYVSGTTATIQWVTSEPADSTIIYGLTDEYGASIGDGNRRLYHDLTIRNLQPGRIYHYKVGSRDEDNNKSLWQDKTFTTIPHLRAENEDLVISDVRPASVNDTNISDTSAIISFRTNHLVDCRIEYGTSRGFGRNVDCPKPRRIDQQIQLTNLETGTNYNFKIHATDVFFKRVEYQGSFKTKGQVLGVDNFSGPSQFTEDTITGSGQLVLYSNFDSGFGNIAYDSSGLNNDGSISGATWQKENNNSYLDFDGVNDVVKVPHRSSLNMNDNQVTMAAWVNLDSFTRFGKIVSKHYSYELLQATGLGGLRIAIQPIGGRWHTLDTSNAPLALNTWQFVAGTYDGQTMRLYVNGVEVASKDDVFTIANSAQDISIGANGVNDIEYLDGSMDEIRVYNYALSAFDIEQLYNQGLYKITGIGSGVGGSIGGVNGNLSGSSGTLGGGQVLGSSLSDYTKAERLIRVAGQPDIYAVYGGKKLYISGPTAFANYGYNLADVEDISQAEFDSIIGAWLVKTPDAPTVYYIDQTKWLKIPIPSPTAFVSYQQNDWGEIITIDPLDLRPYPLVEVVKSPTDGTVYELNYQLGTKNLIPSAERFLELGYEWPEVMTLSQTHLDYYELGDTL